MSSTTPLQQEMRELHHEVSMHLFGLVDWTNFDHVSDRYNLDLLEKSLYHELRSGRDDVLTLYSHYLGGYRHLAWRLADYQRGLRITSLLVDRLGIDHHDSFRGSPWHDRSLFHLDPGHVTVAEVQIREMLQQTGLLMNPNGRSLITTQA